MRNRSRWLLCFSGASVFLALILGFVGWLLLPRLVHSRAIAGLSKAGFANPRLFVSDVRLDRTQLGGLLIGRKDELFYARTVQLNTGLLSLARGDLGDIVIDGARLTVAYDKGRLDHGLIPELKETGSARIPFSRMLLRSSELCIIVGTQRIVIPFEGTVSNRGLEIDFQFNDLLAQGDLALRGRVDVEKGTAVVTVQGARLPAAMLSPVARLSDLPVTVFSSGMVSFVVDATAARGQRFATVSAELGEAPLSLRFAQHTLEARRAKVVLDAKLNPDFSANPLEIEASLHGANLDGFPVEQVQLHVERDGKQTAFRCKAHSEAWKLTELAGTIAPKAAQKAGSTGALSARCSVRAEGRPPAGLAGLAQLAGILVRDPGSFSLTSAIAVDLDWIEGKLGWQARSEDCQVSFSGFNTSWAEGRARVADLSGELGFVVDARQDRLRLGLLDASRVAFADLTWESAGETIRFGRAGFGLSSSKAEPFAEIAFKGERQWRASFLVRSNDSLGLHIGETVSAQLSGLGFRMRMSGMTGGPVADARISEGSFGALVQGTYDGSLATLEAGKCRFDLKLKPQVRSAANGANQAVLDLSIQADPVSGAWTRASGTGKGPATLAAKVSFEGSLVPSNDRTRFLRGSLDTQIASLAIPQYDLFLEALDCRLPIESGPAPERDAGRLRLAALRWRGLKLPPLSGSVALDASGLRFSTRWPILDGAVLESAGRLQYTHGALHGEMQTSMPPVTFSPANQPGLLVPAAKGLVFAGEVSMDGLVGIDGQRVEPRVDVRMAGVSVTAGQARMALEGLDGTVRINSFSPLSTPAGQNLEVKSLTLGKLGFQDGRVAFRFDDASRLFIEWGSWSFAGGRLLTPCSRIDPIAQIFDMTLIAEDLELGEILKLVPDGKASGQALVCGRVPLKVKWPEISFGDGYVYSRSPKGWLRINDPSFLARILEQSDPRFSGTAPMVDLKQRIAEALADFEFSELKLDLYHERDDLVATIHTKGTGRNGHPPQEIGGLTINLKGLDKLLSDSALLEKTLHHLGAKAAP